MHDFATFNDHDLVVWLGTYSGRQAGYYPGLRKSRVAAEAEAGRRGLPWWQAQSHIGGRIAMDTRLVRRVGKGA